MLRIVTYGGAIVLAFGVVIAPASAGLCTDTTSCTVTLGETNTGFSSTNTVQTGDFGTVQLTLDSTTHVATVDVALASGFQIINTGFPGSFGFVDSLGGGLTIGNFSSSLYSNAVSSATTNQHFDGFGYSNNAAATSGPHANSGLQNVSFTVSDGTSLTDVNQLLNAFSTPGDAGATFFVVDAFDSNSGGNLGGRTGLLGVSGTPTVVPEPRGSVFACLGVFALAGWLVRRRNHTGTQLN